MSTRVRRVTHAAMSSIAITLAAGFPLGSTAFAAEGNGATNAETQQSDAAGASDVELPPEVRALLEANPGEPTHSEAPDAPPPLAPLAPTEPLAPPVPPLRGPRRLYADSLAPSSQTDPFFVTSVGTLLAGGAFAALGIALMTIDDSEQVCGQIAGCVDVRSRSSLSREGAGYGLMGAGVGAGLVGGLSLLASYTSAPEVGDTRGSPAQGVFGIGFLGAGGAMLGAGIAGGAAGSRRVSEGVVPALITGGMASGILGIVLVSARPSTERRTPSDVGSLQPAIEVGLGSAQATWSF